MLAAGVLFAVPLAVDAQAPQNARVGVLSTVSRSTSIWLPLLPSALSKLGWVEGSNLRLEWRFAEGRPERLPELATQLTQLGVQVLVATNNIEAQAARRSTRSVPIVALLFAADPVKEGFAESLAHPRGNVTGVLWADPTFTARSVQILKETLPNMRRLGFVHPTGIDGFQTYVDAAEAAARALDVRTYWFPVTRPEDIPAALVAAKNERVDLLRVSSATGPLAAATPQIHEFAASNRIPTSWTATREVERGGFISYTPSISEQVSRGAALVDKLLKGAKPGDLPFEYPTRYELVINLKTAKALGITVPSSILLRADRVIE